MQLTASKPVVSATAWKPISSLPDLGGRIPELDGLRGLAIAMILVTHYLLLIYSAPFGSPVAHLLAMGRLGWTGVDLFFVLSGFLIGGILIDARDSSSYFRVFYTRRFFRIVPIYGLFLLANFSFLVAIHAGKAPVFSWLLRDELPWAPYALFLQNFWMAGRNTMGVASLGLTWSLAIEEQFYLTLPLLVRVLDPRRLLSVVVGGIVGAPLLRIALHLLWPEKLTCWFVLMPCRADALFFGVLGAIIFRKNECRSWLESHGSLQRLFLYVLLSGVAYLTLKVSDTGGFTMLAGGLTWMAVFYFSLLLYALTQKNSMVNLLLRSKWLTWLGTIAYGVYLFHAGILILISHPFWPKPLLTDKFSDLWVSVLALFITLLVCRFSWVYFEKPLVQLGHRVKYDIPRARNSLDLEPAMAELQ